MPDINGTGSGSLLDLILSISCLWTFWTWNKDVVILYSTQYCAIKDTKTPPPVEDACMWQYVLDVQTNLCDLTHKETFTSLKVCNLKVCM